ncbi:MAG: elongation factor G [Gemmatimonadota bacterium]|nr:elongation factor G [Gemmatimonadota bacterium]
MKQYQPEAHRNVTLIGHGGAGKTTVVEALLVTTKVIPRMGSILEGTTALDYLEDEQKKHSVALSMAAIEHGGKKLNLLDTPGFADFSGEVASGLHAGDAALLVVAADSGAEVGSELTWAQARTLGMPRAIVINGMDKEQADGAAALASVREKVSPKAVAMQIPMGSGEDFCGVVDVIRNQAVTFDGNTGKGVKGEVPAEFADALEQARADLMENAAESSEELMNKYFDEGELSQEDLVRGVHEGIAQGDLYPVFYMSAIRNQGSAQLLDGIADLLPGCTDIGAVEGVHPETDEKELREPSPDAPLSALVFKTAIEPHVGEVYFVKVYSGVLTAGAEVYNSGQDRAEKIAQLYHVVGKTRTDTGTLSAGDIGIAVKLKNSRTNDTLCDRSAPVKLTPVKFPEPIIDFSVSARTKGEEDKISTGLARLAQEDSTFAYHFEDETRQTVVSGMGEAHLDLLMKRLTARFHVEVDLETPRIPYRETVRGKADVQGRHKKQTGGRGQFGDVYIRLEPLPSGGGFVFEDEIVGGVVPGRFIPAVEKGIRESLSEGTLAGYPVVDFKVTLYDGSYHAVDSSEAAFKVAGSLAFKKALAEAQSVLLEPHWIIVVMIPKDYMGDVMGDLSSRRCRISGMEAVGEMQVINATGPRAELQRYATDLRAMTQGRGTHSRSFSHYEEVPRDQKERIIADSLKLTEEEVKK